MRGEVRPDRRYVVVRRWRDGGERYVAAECAGVEIAEGTRLRGAEVLTREEMEREASLRRALLAWDRGDDEAWRGEREREERILAGALGVNARVAVAVEAILHGHPSSPGPEPRVLRPIPGLGSRSADADPKDIGTRRRAG